MLIHDTKPNKKDYSEEKYSPEFLNFIRNKQWFWRSKIREKLHSTVFGEAPKDIRTLPPFTSDERINRIIRELASSTSIINNKIHHWTTIDNFKGIIDSRYFYGNALLQKHKMSFQPNALIDADIENGDGQVICFCPYLVDPNCLIKSNQQREGLLRLTIDLNKIETQGRYNQFFKLYDFQSPAFVYSIEITDQLSACFEQVVSAKGRGFYVRLKLGAHSETARLYKREAIFYGELPEINYFCLTRIFYLLEKMKDVQLKEQLKNYLMNNDENELKKILVIFAQSLTIHAEYNFNGALKLTDNLLTEVYLPTENLFVNLNDLTPSEYIQTIMDTTSNRSYKCHKAPLLAMKSYIASPYELDDEEVKIYYPVLYGFEIIRQIKKKINNFISLPATHFSQGKYYETRPLLCEPFSKIEDYLWQPPKYANNLTQTCLSTSKRHIEIDTLQVDEKHLSKQIKLG